MKTREINNIEENDYSNVIIVIGITVTINILFSSLGLDISDTVRYVAKNVAMIF